VYWLIHSKNRHNSIQGWTASGRQVAPTTKFCTVVPNVSRFSKWNLLYVTLMVLTMLRWLLNFWELCTSLTAKRTQGTEKLTFRLWSSTMRPYNLVCRYQRVSGTCCLHFGILTLGTTVPPNNFVTCLPRLHGVTF